jgi:hypothetical protein
MRRLTNKNNMRLHLEFMSILYGQGFGEDCRLDTLSRRNHECVSRSVDDFIKILLELGWLDPVKQGIKPALNVITNLRVVK